MEPGDVLIHLRRCGVVAHHAAGMPPAAFGRSIVVFLEGAMGQSELARSCALGMPGVERVTFSGHTRAIMFVHLKP